MGTVQHLYWDSTTDRWTPAQQLRVGDRLQTSDGATVTIAALHNYIATMFTYNLTIDNLHTYYVLAGDTAVLVHNSACGITMSSSIGDDTLLAKAAEQAGRNQTVQREMDNLFGQLSNGNMNPGIGTKALAGTDVSYVRGGEWGTAVFPKCRGWH